MKFLLNLIQHYKRDLWLTKTNRLKNKIVYIFLHHFRTEITGCLYTATYNHPQVSLLSPTIVSLQKILTLNNTKKKKHFLSVVLFTLLLVIIYKNVAQLLTANKLDFFTLNNLHWLLHCIFAFLSKPMKINYFWANFFSLCEFIFNFFLITILLITF